MGVAAHLEALPGKAAAEQENKGVCKGLQVIPAAGDAAQMCMHTRIPDSPSAVQCSAVCLSYYCRARYTDCTVLTDQSAITNITSIFRGLPTGI